MTTEQILSALSIDDHNLGGFAGEWVGSGPSIDVHTPIDGSRIASVREVTDSEYDEIVDCAQAAFLESFCGTSSMIHHHHVSSP